MSVEKDARATAQALIAEARAVADEDVGRNKEMAKHGGDWLLSQVKDSGESLNVLTVCNTGSLVCELIHAEFGP